MSNSEYDRLAGAVLDLISGEADRERAARLLRLVFRTGAHAQLDHSLAQYRDSEDRLDRLTWIVQQDMFSEDIKALIREVEDRREQERAFTRTYGLTESDLHSMLGEGFHTAFRKAVDHPYAVTIHKLIRDLPDSDYTAIIDFVVEPVIDWLREAEKQSAAGA